MKSRILLRDDIIGITFQTAAGDRIRLVSVERNGNSECNGVAIYKIAFWNRESVRDNLRKSVFSRKSGSEMKQYFEGYHGMDRP